MEKNQYKFDFYKADAAWYGMLKEHAKRMRANPTDAELVLWRHIKGKALGIGFKRQCVILDFIADFLSDEEKLIIEVDGEYHANPEQRERDAYRTQILEEKGYNILRFTNKEVLYDTENVINKIKEYIQ